MIDFCNLKFNIVNIYSPNVASDRKLFFSDLHNYFITQGLLLIGGDFNCIDYTLDKLNCFSVPSVDKTSLASLKSDFCLVDIWRKQNLHEIIFTWSNSDRTQASRLDRLFIAKSLVSQVFSCEILPCVLSDHDILKLDLSLDGLAKRRAGVWRFNNSLLSGPIFKRVLSKVITDFKLKIPIFPSLQEWWDRLKIEIKKACVSFSVRKHKALNSKRASLTKQLIRAKNFTQSAASASVINDLESQLFTLISKEAEGSGRTRNGLKKAKSRLAIFSV